MEFAALMNVSGTCGSSSTSSNLSSSIISAADSGTNDGSIVCSYMRDTMLAQLGSVKSTVGVESVVLIHWDVYMKATEQTDGFSRLQRTVQLLQSMAPQMSSVSMKSLLYVLQKLGHCCGSSLFGSYDSLRSLCARAGNWKALSVLHRYCNQGCGRCSGPVTTENGFMQSRSFVTVSELSDLCHTVANRDHLQSNRRYDAIRCTVQMGFPGGSVLDKIFRIVKSTYALTDLDCDIWTVIKQFARSADHVAEEIHFGRDLDVNTASAIISTIIRVCGFLDDFSLVSFINEMLAQPLTKCLHLSRLFRKSRALNSRQHVCEATELLKRTFLTGQSVNEIRSVAGEVGATGKPTSSPPSLFPQAGFDGACSISSLTLELWCNWLFSMAELVEGSISAVEHVCRRFDEIGIFNVDSDLLKALQLNSSMKLSWKPEACDAAESLTVDNIGVAARNLEGSKETLLPSNFVNEFLSWNADNILTQVDILCFKHQNCTYYLIFGLLAESVVAVQS
jgi:hypothetical protein